MHFKSLTIRLGNQARNIIEDQGLHPDQVAVMPAASGGAKWIILNQLDRYLFPWALNRRSDNPLHTIATSIGAWRMAALANNDPIAALDRFKDGYFSFTYDESNSTPTQITLESYPVLKHLAGGQYGKDILSNPKVRSHILTNRAKGIFAVDNKAVLMPALATIAGLNFLSRKAIGIGFQRVFFNDPRTPAPFAKATQYDPQWVDLTPNNIEDAIIATSAIPVVMAGVKDILGAPKGMYRDGGMTDYHFDLDFLGLKQNNTETNPYANKLVLYPHFMDRQHPGWFDKFIPHRQPQAAALDNMVFIAPKDEWVASLPYGKIPDRHDFVKMANEDRLNYWNRVLDLSKIMTEELDQWINLGAPISLTQKFNKV